MSARAIWGKVIIYLREHNNPILHIVCGDITNVQKLEDNTFVITTDQSNVIDFLKEQGNFDDLKTALEVYGITNLEIKQSEKAQSEDENIRMLNNYFDDMVIVKRKNKE